MAAFVTGGSGFIGGKLIERLVSSGEKVRALARSDASAARVAELGAEPVRGEIGDRASLEAGVAGCERAFHAAAKVEDSGPWEEFLRDNVGGTRNVVDACEAAGVRRLVHVSTEAVLIAGDPLVNVDETAPRRTDSKAPYPRSKAMAEEVLLAAGGSMERVVLRPRFVWGAGDTSLLPGILALVHAGRFAWIGGGRHLTDTTHVENVVEGLVLAAEKGRDREIYFVTDGEPVVFREFVSELISTQGEEPPTRSVPRPVAAALAAGGETVWNALHLRGAPPLSRFAFWVSSQECTINIAKARAELGYAPVRSRADGLAEMSAA
jgi:nucleoside-diphosphate-sugar epimerase